MLKRLCQSVGLASLILVMNYGDLLGGGADVRMHVPRPLVMVCAAQIADIVVLGAAIFAVLALTKRTRMYRWVRLFFLALVPPYILLRISDLFPFHLHGAEGWPLAVAWMLAVVTVSVRSPLAYRRMARTADVLGIFLALFAVCSIVQLIAVMFWRPGPEQIGVTGAASAPSAARDGHRRLVWVLFDELSYDQTFGHRAEGLALPNFDALRGQSTLFTDVQPVGLHTVKVLPSLLSGHEVDDYRFSFANRLRVHYVQEHGWHRLTGAQTVFGDAQRAGWKTAAVGWYNPYCTLYGDALNDCYWQNEDRMDGGMTLDGSFAKNVWRPLKNIAVQAVSIKRAGMRGCNLDVRQRAKTERDLDTHALDMLRNDNDDLVFLHLAVPHSPNIWSRKEERFVSRCGQSYVDNLALTDRVLGQMMAVLEQSPRWKDTTVIVEGDHSWRVQLWDWLPAWTAEDARVSHDVFDTRPALLIHDAGQTDAKTNANAIPLTDVHGAVENVLGGKPAVAQ